MPDNPIELCPIIQQKRQRPETTTYLRRRTNSAIKFRWQLETTNSCFWLANILWRKFDCSLKKRIENDKNTKCYDEKQQINALKLYDSIK